MGREMIAVPKGKNGRRMPTQEELEEHFRAVLQSPKEAREDRTYIEPGEEARRREWFKEAYDQG